jgi:hypothetical protein
MQVHRRQFVIGPRPITLVPGWMTTPLPHGGYLSHCPDLPVASTIDAHDNVWYLLGLAIQTDATQGDPITALSTATPATVHTVSQSWAGRWILIGAGTLTMDAGGLLGCFYGRKETKHGTTELWVSSSAAVLAEVLAVEPTPVRAIYHAVGIDWYPPPHARLRSLRRLLPSQVLVLTTGELRARRLLPHHAHPVPYDQVLDTLQQYLVTALRQAATLATTLWLPLTAGYDSRLLLAAATYAGIPVRTYTHVHPAIRAADQTIPPQLAAAVGVRHALYCGGAFNKARVAAYDRHTGGQCVDRDRYYLAHEYFTWCQKGDLILGGGCFEIGRCLLWDSFPTPGLQVHPPSAETIVREYQHGFNPSWIKRIDPSLVQALDAWIAWTQQTAHDELDWRDRFYLEQRMGGWLSAIEQSLDVLAAVRVQVANSQVYFAQVLQIAPEQRRRSQHHCDLINRMAPELGRFPFNPPPPVHQRIRRKLQLGTEYVRSRMAVLTSQWC